MNGHEYLYCVLRNLGRVTAHRSLFSSDVSESLIERSCPAAASFNMGLEGTGCSAVLSFSPVHDRDSAANHGLLGPMTSGSVIACLMMMV